MRGGGFFCPLQPQKHNDIVPRAGGDRIKADSIFLFLILKQTVLVRSPPTRGTGKFCWSKGICNPYWSEDF